jgi:hypothetical protein
MRRAYLSLSLKPVDCFSGRIETNEHKKTRLLQATGLILSFMILPNHRVIINPPHFHHHWCELLPALLIDYINIFSA